MLNVVASYVTLVIGMVVYLITGNEAFIVLGALPGAVWFVYYQVVALHLRARFARQLISDGLDPAYAIWQMSLAASGLLQIEQLLSDKPAKQPSDQ